MLIGIVAVMLFVATAFYVNRHIAGLRAPAAPPVDKPQVTRVVVAARDIAIGTTLDSAHLRTIEWPTGAVPAGAVSDEQSIVGSLTIASVLQNEPLLRNKLVKGEGHSLLPLKIPSGFRAVSIRVNAVSGISGFVAPGTKVDVIAVMNSQQGDGGASALTLLEDLEVLAIAQEMAAPASEPTVVKTITLLVTPAQAERLALAANGGTLQLTLRGYTDQRPAGTNGVSMDDITPTRTGPKNVVELIRGKDRAVHTF